MKRSQHTAALVRLTTPMKRRCILEQDHMSLMSIHTIKRPRFSRHSRLTFCSQSLSICSKMKRMIQVKAKSRGVKSSLKSSHLIGKWSSLCTVFWIIRKYRAANRMRCKLKLTMKCRLELRRRTHSKMKKRRPLCQSTSLSKCRLRFYVFLTKQSLQCNSLARVVLLCSSMRTWRTTCKSCRSITMPDLTTRMRALNDVLLLT